MADKLQLQLAVNIISCHWQLMPSHAGRRPPVQKSASMARALKVHADLLTLMKCMCVYRIYLSQEKAPGVSCHWTEKLHETRLVTLYSCQGSHVLTNKWEMGCDHNRPKRKYVLGGIPQYWWIWAFQEPLKSPYITVWITWLDWIISLIEWFTWLFMCWLISLDCIGL